MDSIAVFRDGTHVRDYLNVSDLSKAVIKVVNGKLTPGDYELGTGKGVSVNQLISTPTGAYPAFCRSSISCVPINPLLQDLFTEVLEHFMFILEEIAFQAFLEERPPSLSSLE